jgi:2-dehydropantoate 2-reductase
MKIAVVGCGALGGFYAARIARTGATVHCLLRSDYDSVRRHGLRIESVDGDFHVYPRCARDPAEIGPCDLVVIGLKTTANHRFPDLLPPLVGPDTTLLTLQNGLGNEAALAALFGPDRVTGGLCFVCLNRVAPGTIRHTAHGLVVLGEYQRAATPRLHGVRDLFERAGVPCRMTDHLEAAHWEKLVWNIPFNGLGVAGVAPIEALLEGTLPPAFRPGPCLSTDRLLGDPGWERLVRELMLEILATARALGYPLDDRLADQNIERTRVMGAYQASTLIDYQRHMPLELDALFREPLRQAQSAGIPTPRLAALCRILEQLDQRRSSTGTAAASTRSGEGASDRG